MPTSLTSCPDRRDALLFNVNIVCDGNLTKHGGTLGKNLESLREN